jgi:pimeloyl-ACP methyl ester carboxylesterase
MMKKLSIFSLALILAILMILPTASIAEPAVVEPISEAFEYDYEEFPLERNGIELHLDRVKVEGTEPERNILLVHGLTYSSHEFDINYEDYSLVRLLARDGYAVWRVDVAGYGRSGQVEDGFQPDSDYAGEDINAAVEKIVVETGIDKIDVLGWSWGTVTSSRYAVKYPEHLNKLILYAPILSGLGAYDITDAFHYNTWEHAADDFQLDAEGHYDLTITDPVVIELYCSSCWHYDRDYSPNGGRRDLCVDASEKLIDLDSIQAPTLVICGDKDPYLNFDLVNTALEHLPEGSELVVIPGASHAVMIEAPFYHEFQNSVLAYLDE